MVIIDLIVFCLSSKFELNLFGIRNFKAKQAAAVLKFCRILSLTHLLWINIFDSFIFCKVNNIFGSFWWVSWSSPHRGCYVRRETRQCSLGWWYKCSSIKFKNPFIWVWLAFTFKANFYWTNFQKCDKLFYFSLFVNHQ